MDLPERCRAKYEALIGPVREAARALGYAVAVHGSLARDIDLVAVPWTPEAAPATEVAEAIRAASEAAVGYATRLHHVEQNDAFFAIGMPGAKPHGRRVWSFHLGGGPYIDLSVMPRAEYEDGAEAMKAEVQP